MWMTPKMNLGVIKLSKIDPSSLFEPYRETQLTSESIPLLGKFKGPIIDSNLEKKLRIINQFSQKTTQTEIDQEIPQKSMNFEIQTGKFVNTAILFQFSH
jgi:hypothetical protein